MPDIKKNRTGLYNHFKDDIEGVNSEEEFYEKLDDPKKRKAFYDNFQNKIDADYNTFEKGLGYKSKATEFFSEQFQPEPVGVLAPSKNKAEKKENTTTTPPIKTTVAESTRVSPILEIDNEPFAVTDLKDKDPLNVGKEKILNYETRYQEGVRSNKERTEYDLGMEALSNSRNEAINNIDKVKRRVNAIKGSDNAFDDYINAFQSISTSIDKDPDRKDPKTNALISDFKKNWNDIHENDFVQTYLFPSYDFLNKIPDAHNALKQQTPNYQSYLIDVEKKQVEADNKSFWDTSESIIPFGVGRMIKKVVGGTFPGDVAAVGKALTDWQYFYDLGEEAKTIEEKNPNATRFQRNIVEDYVHDKDLNVDLVFGPTPESKLPKFQYAVDPETGNKVDLIFNDEVQAKVNQYEAKQEFNTRRLPKAMAVQGGEEFIQEIPGLLLAIASDGALSGALKTIRSAKVTGTAGKIIKGANSIINTPIVNKITPKHAGAWIGEIAGAGIEGSADYREEGLKAGLSEDEVTLYQIAAGANNASQDIMVPPEIFVATGMGRRFFKDKLADYSSGKISKADLFKETGVAGLKNLTQTIGLETAGEAVIEPTVSNNIKKAFNELKGSSFETEDIDKRSIETAFWMSVFSAGPFAIPTSVRFSKKGLMRDAIKYAIKNPDVVDSYFQGRRADQGGDALEREQYIKTVLDQVREAKMSEADQLKAATLMFDRQNASLEAEMLREKYGPDAPLFQKKQKEVGALSNAISDMFDKPASEQTDAVEVATADTAPDDASGADLLPSQQGDPKDQNPAEEAAVEQSSPVRQPVPSKEKEEDFKSENIIRLEKEAEDAKNRLKSAKTKLSSKRDKLTTTLQDDTEDLFGERKSNTSDKLFDERASGNIEELLAEEKAEVSAAEKAMNAAENNLKKAREAKDPSLFESAEKKPTARQYQAQIIAKFRDEYAKAGLPSEKIEAGIQLLEARAKAWASEKPGRSPEEWYARIGDIKPGEIKSVAESNNPKAAIENIESKKEPDTDDDLRKELLENAKTDQPKSEQVGSVVDEVVGPKKQNFTQFAKDNGYPNDDDTLFQAQLLGGRGLEGKRQSNRSIKEQDDAFHEMLNKKSEGKKAYEQAILDGKVIDPDGKLTRESILKRDYDFNKKELESKIANAESGIKNIEGLGKMAHLDNGKLKKGYQRAVDDYNETIIKNKEALDKLKKEYEQSIKEQSKSKVDNDIEKIWEYFGNQGIVKTPEQQAKDLEMGIKLVGLYLKKGIYKLEDIVNAGIEKLGLDKINNLLQSIKNGYLAYQVNATDAELEQMDDVKTIRNFTITKPATDTQSIEKTDTTNKISDGKTRTKLDRPKLDKVPARQQPDLFSSAPSELPTEDASTKEADRVRGKSEEVQREQEPTTGGSGGISNADIVPVDDPKYIPIEEAPGEIITIGEVPENFVIDPGSFPTTFNVKKRFNDNIAALETLSNILKEKRYATKEEQETLSKYVGWGGIKVVLNDINSTWNKSDEELRPQVKNLHEILKNLEDLGLKNLLSAIKASTLNAHYTSIGVINGIYKAIKQFGFTGGHLLEPSAGIGNFIGAMPLDIRDNSKITQVELDSLTGQILKQLYPRTSIHIKGLQEANLPNNYYDLIISNIPFGDYRIYDKKFTTNELKQFGSRIHNYFFAKAIQQAKEGGLIAFVTSAGVMDSDGNEQIRKYIRDNTNFIGAIRLPNTAFVGNANTEVVTDIIFLLKTSNPENKTTFIDNVGMDVEHKDTKEKKRIKINEYFFNNPQNVIGTFKAGGLYRDNEMTLVADSGTDIQKEIEKIIDETFPRNILHAQETKTYEEIKDDPIADESLKVGEIYIGPDGFAYVKLDSSGNVEKMPASQSIKKIKDFIALRDTLNAQYNLESESAVASKVVEENRSALNNAYDNFVTKHGRLSKKENKSLLNKDINGFNMASLETKTGKADIFKKRVINAKKVVDKTDNIHDAIIVSLNEYGRVDVEMIASLMGQSPEDVVKINYGILFYDSNGQAVTREEYLSGNVKKKLSEANELAKTNPIYDQNVAALREVIPEDVPASLIDVNIGSRWIPVQVYEEFINEIFNTSSSVSFSRATDTFKISAPQTVESKNKYGTSRANGIELLTLSMHNVVAVVRDKVSVNPDKYVTNLEETALAREKQDLIKEEFAEWIWKAEDRREKLGRIYNDLFNTTIKRKYDGSYIVFEGLNNVNLYQHQKDAVAMLVANNGGIIDHAVGAGKTYTMIASAMKMKQMGIANKPTIIGLKSTIPHLVRDAKSAYPTAKILTPTEGDFKAKNRKAFLSKIQNNDWDIIIMSHEQFSSIPQDPEVQIDVINSELQMLDDEIKALEREGKEASKQVLKGLEKRKLNLNAKLQKLADTIKDIEILNFKQIGIDHLMVDESQMFKNLEYSTRINKVAGLGKREGSKRAFNLLTAARTLQRLHGGDKGITFSSGTPISNSLVEMYLLFKYLRPSKMEELGYKTFDAWVTQFAESSSEIEFSVSSDVKQNLRFRKFINLPELSMLYNEIADVKNDSNLVLKKPNIKGYINKEGTLIREPQLIAVPQSEYQQEWTKRIIEFANQKHGDRDGNLIGKGGLSDSQQTAAMLMVTNLSNKLSIDMRLIDKTAEDNPTGKLSAAARNISKIYHDTTERKGTQLIFSDTGTPKTKNTVENLKNYLQDDLNKGIDDINAIFGEEGARLPVIKVARERMIDIFEITPEEADDIIAAAIESEGEFNVYDELKRKLIENGVPEDQIVYIHSYNTKKSKEELFDKVNAGEIRIVLGSTQKLGTGVNAQKKIVALHHIDASWNPAMMEQRNGRGIRQGNENEEVAIFNYGTELTLDAYKYQLIATKQRFINQVKSGATGDERSVKEGDGEDMGAQEMVAILSGNPLLIELAKVDNLVTKLKRSKKSFIAESQKTESLRNATKANIPVVEEEIAKRKKDIDIVTANGKEEDGKIKVVHNIPSKSPIENAKDLGQAIIDAKKAILKKPLGATEIIGTVNGLQLKGNSIRVEANNAIGIFAENEVRLTLNGEFSYHVTSSADPTAQGVALGNTINKLETALNTRKEDLERNKSNLIKYNKLLNEEWEKQPELDAAIKRQKEINDALSRPATQPNVEAEEGIDDNKVRERDLIYTAHDESVFISLADGTDTKNNKEISVVRINQQLKPEIYASIVKPLIKQYNGEWNTSSKNILFYDKENAIAFKKYIEKEFNVEEGQVRYQMTEDGLEEAKRIIVASDNFQDMLKQIALVFEGDLTISERATIRENGGLDAFVLGFETYLQAGIAPNKKLQSLFDKFKMWLIEVYASVTKKISPDISRIFDRLLSQANLPEYLANPIDPNKTQSDKADDLRRLSESNEALVAEFIKKVDEKLGTNSKASFKDKDKIISKANRPSIQVSFPGYDVENIRDSYRFKTVLSSVEQILEIYKLVKESPFRIAKIDVDKLFSPKEWGFRIASFDLIAPNGQLIEYYFPIAEIEAAKKDKNHDLFEKWRERDFSRLTKAEQEEYANDVAISKAAYDKAWKTYLSREGLSETALRANLSQLSLSPSELTGEKLSLRSNASGTEADQADLLKTRDTKPAPTPQRTQALSGPATETRNLGNSSNIGPNIQQTDEKKVVQSPKRYVTGFNWFSDGPLIPPPKPPKVKTLVKGTKKKNRKLRNKDYIRAISHIISDARDLVIVSFIKGEKIHSDVIKSLYKNPGREVGVRLGLINNFSGHKTAESFAHYLWSIQEQEFGIEKFDTSEFLNAIEEVINDHVGLAKMVEEINEKYDEEEYYQPNPEMEEDFASDEDDKEITDDSDQTQEDDEPLPFQKGMVLEAGSDESIKEQAHKKKCK